jgi:hypothetical protein
MGCILSRLGHPPPRGVMKMGVIGKILSFSPCGLKLSLNVRNLSYGNVRSLSFTELWTEGKPNLNLTISLKRCRLKESVRPVGKTDLTLFVFLGANKWTITT